MWGHCVVAVAPDNRFWICEEGERANVDALWNSRIPRTRNNSEQSTFGCETTLSPYTVSRDVWFNGCCFLNARIIKCLKTLVGLYAIFVYYFLFTPDQFNFISQYFRSFRVGLQQGRRLVVLWYSCLRNGRRISTFLRRSADPDLRKNCFRKGLNDLFKQF